MGSRKQFIRTGRYRRWQILRWGAWIVPLVDLVRAWNMNYPYMREAVANSSNHALATVAAGSIMLLAVMVASFPVFFPWWCICTMLMSRARREATFVPTRDLEYYRERLDGLSAVQVSLLADLRVEPREDATATLLSLERRGIVSMEGDQARLLDAGRLQALPSSDRLLVELATTGNLNASTYGQWAERAEEEAVDGIHLRRIGRKDSTATTGCNWFLRGCGTGCLLILALCGVFSLFSVTIGQDLMELLDTAENDYEMVALMIENPLLAVQLLIMVVIAILMIVAFLLPLVDTVRGLVENGDASRHLRRTQLGEEEAELVYGIRNYVRDFTALSDADRHALMLWDDFMVYAVALGQNPRVVADLVRMLRHVDPESDGQVAPLPGEGSQV